MEYNWVKSDPTRPVRIGDLMRWRDFPEGEALSGPYRATKIVSDAVYYGDKSGNSLKGQAISPTNLNENGFYVFPGLYEYTGTVLEYCHVPKKTVMLIIK